MLTIQLLGPLQAAWIGDDIVLTRRLERALLARLALDPGRVVGATQLVEDLWGDGDSGPRDAQSSLQTLVYRLRRSLGPAAALLEAAGGGYRLAVTREQVDACCFERLVDESSRAGDWSVTRQLLAEALELWRGAPLADLHAIPFVPPQAVRLSAARLDAIAERVAADLATGRHATVVPELEALVRQEPYQERIWRQLMLAHYRSGSQTAALRTATRLRENLAQDLGLEPDPTTQALEAAIFAHDPGLAPPFVAGGPRGVGPLDGRPPANGAGTVATGTAFPGPLLMAVVRVQTTARGADVDRAIGDAFIEAVLKAGGTVVSARVPLTASFADVGAAVSAAVALERSQAGSGGAGEDQPALAIGIGRQADPHAAGSPTDTAVALAASASGGQLLISDTALGGDPVLPPGVVAHALGSFLLAALDEPVHVSQLSANGLAEQFPPLERVGHATVRMPQSTNSFVGRSEELADIAAHLRAGALVTLVAAGGTGKTRLSREAAGALLPTMRTDVHFVALEDVGGGGVAGHTATTALGDAPLARAEGSADPLGALCDYFAGRRGLLILDNCEHVLEETAALVLALRRHCPALAVLATSRTRLGLADERVVALAPLPVADDWRPARGATPSPAAQLFCDRAAAANPSFEISPASQALIERICRAVDGLPLAIELAAARMRTITVGQMAERLTNLLSLLRQPRSGFPQRHQSLEQAIAWSYDLLEPLEQRLLAWTSVFVGGFSLEAFEHLADEAGAEGSGLDLLESLCDKSLITAELGADRVRYRLAAPVREFAASRLRALGEASDAELAHFAFFAALGRSTEAEISVEGTPVQLRALTSENDNFVAAIRRAGTDGRRNEALLLALGLHAFWEETGNLTEASALIEALAGDDLRDPMTFRGIAVLLAYAPMCGNLRQAAELAEALTPALQRDLGPRQAAQLRYTIAFVHSASGDLDTAIDLWAEAGRLLTGVDNHFARHALFNAGHSSTHAGRFDDARTYLEQAAALPPPVQGWFADLARVNRELIGIYTGSGDPHQLVASARSVDARGLRFRLVLASVDAALGLHRAGLDDGAETWWRRLLDIGLDMGNVWAALVGLEFAGWSAAAAGEDEQAAEIWGCVDRTASERRYGWWDLIAREAAEQRRLVTARSPDAAAAGTRQGRATALNELADAVRAQRPSTPRAT